MSESRAPRPAGGSDRGALVRAWAGALGRLLLFGILFVALVEILGLLTYVWDARGDAAIVKGGLLWLVAALAASTLALHMLDRRSWRALGIAPDRAALRRTGAGLLFGVGMIVVAVVIMFASRDLMFGSDAGAAGEAVATMARSLLVLAPAAAAEEAIFRGYPIQVLARVGGGPLAVLTASAAFAAVHADNPAIGPLALANIFLAGVLLGVVYLRTASLWAATAVHLGWNWGMAGLFDLPVSGLGWIDVPGFEPWVVGPVWWNGGAFGPEGGAIGTLVFVTATVLALKLHWFDRDVAADPRARMLCD